MSATMLPPRTLAQRMKALDAANEIRTYRAELKRKIKAGRVSAADVLLEPGPLLETMHVFDLLLAVPRQGRVKTNKILRQANISPSKTLGGMTQRQRSELAGLLRADQVRRDARRVAA